MQELLFLLLPLAFFAGWRSARRKYKKRKAGQDEPFSFRRGINFLLTEQPDKALDLLLDNPSNDKASVETFLAIGQMFRQRGETNRAMRVHQFIMGKPGVASAQRQEAMLALGKDYMAAGMLDRSESVFREIQSRHKNQPEAVMQLRRIYEQLQDWDKAIALTQKSKDLPEDKKLLLLAHYHCELAQAALDRQALYEAKQHIQQAHQLDVVSGRIELIQACIEVAENHEDQALNRLVKLVKTEPKLFANRIKTVVDLLSTSRLTVLQSKIAESFAGADSQDSKAIFRAIICLTQKTGDVSAIPPWFDQLRQKNAVDFQDIVQLVNHPLFDSTALEAQTRVNRYQAISTIAAGSSPYRCQQCGYQLQQHCWRCPACHQWDTVTTGGEV